MSSESKNQQTHKRRRSFVTSSRADGWSVPRREMKCFFGSGSKINERIFQFDAISNAARNERNERAVKQPVSGLALSFACCIH